MKYVFVDTDNGVTTPSGTEDGSTGKYHTTSSWPASTATWSSLANVFANATIRGITDDVTVYCKGATADTNGGSTSNMTCASLLIEGDINAPVWSTSKYRIVYTGASASPLTLTGANVGSVTLRKLQIESNGTSTAPIVVTFSLGQNNKTGSVENCIIRMGSTGRSNATSSARGVSFAGTSSGLTFAISNSVIYDVGSGSNVAVYGVRQANTTNAVTVQIYNSNIINITNNGAATAFGIECQSADTVTVKNCAVLAEDDFSNCDTVAYCASDDGDGTNALSGLTWTNEFTDYTNGDFRLKAGSSLIGAGIGPSSDANVPTTDIAGVTRSGTTTDIGAAMYVSTGLSITSVDTDNAVLAGQSQATFAGTGLASTAKFAVKRGSAIAYGADISLSGSTGGSFTAPTMTAMFNAGVPFGDCAFYAAELSGTAIASISGSITTATNWKYVNVTDLSATGSMGSLFYQNAVSLSDQVAYSSVTTRFKWPVTVTGDGYFTVNSSGSQAGDEFAYRIWDETDSTWGTAGTIEVNGGISSAEQVYAAGSLVQVSLESSTLEGATLQ